jgi:hypothetical protein
MNVEMGTEAAQFPEKEYINGIFLAVYNAEYKRCQPGKGLPPYRVGLYTFFHLFMQHVFRVGHS